MLAVENFLRWIPSLEAVEFHTMDRLRGGLESVMLYTGGTDGKSTMDDDSVAWWMTGRH
jgi:hypothetical protein